MNAIIISAKFTPGHISHLKAFYALYSEMGYTTILLLDEQYKQSFEKQYRIVYLTRDAKLPEADLGLVYNLSTVDISILKKLQCQKRCKIFFVYHEPWYGVKKWMTDIFHHKVKEIVLIKNIGIHLYAKRLLRYVDIVLLPSVKAMEVYKKYDFKYNQRAKIFPLIFEDEIHDKTKKEERKYFSFIATADREKNFPLFIEFITKYLPLDEKLNVQIVTRSNISEFWNPELDSYVHNGRIKLQAGRNLNNDEINDALLQSKCTWLYYYHSTQSGVLARAFMCGSPVLASAGGCFGDYVNQENGRICKKDDLDTIYAAYQEINQRQNKMVQGAQAGFKRFLYSNYVDLMYKIVENA